MDYLREIAKKHWGGIIIVSLMGAVAGLWLSFRQAPLYASNTRVLVHQTGITADGFTALRASERMGQMLAQVMGTASFLDKVLLSGFAVRNEFPQDEAQRREMWADMLQVSMVPDSSILDITIFHRDREQAERIVAAVSSVLSANAKEYLGIDNLNVQVVDAPLTSVKPVKPNMPVNVAMGLLIGFILSTGVTLLRELFTPLPQGVTGSATRAHPASVAIPSVPVGTSTPIEELQPSVIRTMYDHVKAPFGGQYFFQHKLIQLEELAHN